jgi:hypothetical protein
MKRIDYIFTLIATLLLLASCGSSGDEPSPSTKPKVVLRMLVQAPKAPSSRIADPGTSTGEADLWDTFLLAFVYKSDEAGANTVIVDRITRTQFNQLERYNDNDNVRYYTIQLMPGVVYCYGIAYSSDATDYDIYRRLQQCTSKEAVDNLLISNSYAAGSADATSKFLSVATGYYRDLKDKTRQGTIDITNAAASAESPYNVPVLRLVRLACKIDVQWDAASAFTGSQLRAYVTGFKYTSNPSVTGAGSGRLFPELATSTEAVGGSTAFLNTSEISQRNGRAYHYVFPESQKAVGTKPKLTFDVNGVDAYGTTKQSVVTVNFSSQPQAATWYKINATVSGISADKQFTWDITQTQGTN